MVEEPTNITEPSQEAEEQATDVSTPTGETGEETMSMELPGVAMDDDVDQDGPADVPEDAPTHDELGREIPASDRPAKKAKDRIKGIFSTQSVQKVGTGTTVRKTVQKTFWMIEEMDDGSLRIQPLNKNYIPSGPKRKIAMDDLLQKFNPEPEFYVHTVFPAIQELNKTVDKGEEHRAKGEFFSAEFEFANALKVDVDNVRANFGLGLTYLERGENKKADNIFERLVKLDAAFESEHKHLFNEFGINLRKNKMYSQALDYYQRAMQLAQADENLHYNIARAFFEQGQTEHAVKHLHKALEMNPQLEAAQQFLAWLQEKGFVTADGEVTDLKPSDVPPSGKKAKPTAQSGPDAATSGGEESDAPLPAGIGLGGGYNVD